MGAVQLGVWPEPDRLHRPDPARDPRWPSKEPDRRPHALVLRPDVKPRRV